MNRSKVAVWLIAGCYLLLTGCTGKPSRVDQPGYSSGAGAAAIKAYDMDGNGSIGGDELDSVGSLKAAINQVDSDGNGLVTAEEIDGRIDAWKESRVGLMAAICEVTLDGNPLANAKVVLEPEPFLGSNLPSGSGTTGEGGMVGIAQPDQTPRMPCGFYKIRVTSPSHKIPARYNSKSILGCEVANHSHWQNAGAVKLKLTSK